MGTILIDPPWPTFNAVLPYLTVSLDELQRLPVPDLAAERCHLHMWATANNFVFDAKEVIESWGFRVVGNFVWVKPQLGHGNYWRQSHEIMLTAFEAMMIGLTIAVCEAGSRPHAVAIVKNLMSCAK